MVLTLAGLAVGSLGLRFPLCLSSPLSLGSLEELAIRVDVVQVAPEDHREDHKLVVCPFPLMAGHLPEEGRGQVPGRQSFQRCLLSKVAAGLMTQAPLGQLGRLAWRHSPG